MITKIKINNFKSLVRFSLELGEFNCLIGLNGSGKSTVLQALDFLSHLMIGDVQEWLKLRQWDSSDLNSKLTNTSNIGYKIYFVFEGEKVEWYGNFNRSLLQCTKESISVEGKKILSVEGAEYVLNDTVSYVNFEYQGSILSRLKENLLDDTLLKVKEAVTNLRSLDLISPELLRSRTRSSSGKLGLGGENLAAFIYESGPNLISKLKNKLQHVYPQIDDIKIKSLRSGWKELEITEAFLDVKNELKDHKNIKSKARHVNDGMLRLMAVFTQLETESNFLLFDEIENGINPELVEYLVDSLVKTKQQILITTHSPMILNYLEDHVAKSGVTYLYKNKLGHTKAIRFFSIPSMAKKLEFMGPGEVFIDTDLSKLSDEIIEKEET